MSREFFLGKWKDDTAGGRAQIPPDRFTTHGVIIGMTGSGKTGLIVSLLEEAALAGLPTLVIDPKGDLTDRLLVFPGGRPEEFAPYCPAGQAEDTARSWNDGLAAWGLGPQDAAALKGVPVRVFTPGASAAPINVLQRFAAPSQADAETMAASSLGAVSSLFILSGMDGDPGTCPEGLLLNQLLLKGWSEGCGLTLEDLVQQVLSPPLQRLGVMDLDAVIPPKERTALAMRLNALLASPTLSLWRQGSPLDLEAFLGPKAGASQTIFTLAHLTENERLFFLGLLLSELVGLDPSPAWDGAPAGPDRVRRGLRLLPALPPQPSDERTPPRPAQTGPRLRGRSRSCQPEPRGPGLQGPHERRALVPRPPPDGAGPEEGFGRPGRSAGRRGGGRTTCRPSLPHFRGPRRTRLRATSSQHPTVHVLSGGTAHRAPAEGTPAEPVATFSTAFGC